MATRWGFGADLAIDLGTATTVIYQRGAGVMLDEPSLIATDPRTGALLAVGQDGYEMLGRAPGQVQLVRPLVGGVIRDPVAAERMVRHLVTSLRPSRIVRPRMAVALPGHVSPLERAAVEDAVLRSGARSVFTVDGTLAAAIGAEEQVSGPSACLIADIGAGKTDLALISLGGTVVARTLPIGGDTLDHAIVEWMTRQHRLLLGTRTAEDIKVRIGSAGARGPAGPMRVRGRDIDSGLPRTVVVSPDDVREALAAAVAELREALAALIGQAPPELAGDLVGGGLTLTGGGALLHGLAQHLSESLQVPVRVADNPRWSTALGVGRCVEDFRGMRSMLTESVR